MGGTKTLSALGSSPDDLSPVLTIPTTDPMQTLGRVIDHLSAGSPEAVGIASFGPVTLRNNEVWKVADVAVGGGGCRVADLAGPSGPTIVTQEEARMRR